MSSELQIQSSTLGAIAARAVQTKLAAISPRGIEFEKLVVSPTAPIAITAANAAVRLQVSVEMMISNHTLTPTNTNGVSTRWNSRPNTITATLELATTGVIATLRCVDVDLGSVEPDLGENAAMVRTALIASIGSPLACDLSGAFEKLGVPVPRFSRVDLVAGVVAVRFEPAGAAVSRLSTDQAWGFFLDHAAVEMLARSKGPTALTSHLSSLVIDARWRPSGSTPHVDLDYSCKTQQAPNPAVGDVSGTIGCDFALTLTPAKLLRTTVRWSLDINLGTLVPGFVKDIVKDAITGFMDPARFGGIPVGENSFVLENALPEISLGETRLEYNALTATPSGMIFSGAVKPAATSSPNTGDEVAFDRELVSCSCSTSGNLVLCSYCQNRTGQTKRAERVQSHVKPAGNNLIWDGDLLATVLDSLRKAEAWASASLPCRDFVAFTAGRRPIAGSIPDNRAGVIASRSARATLAPY